MEFAIAAAVGLTCGLLAYSLLGWLGRLLHRSGRVSSSQRRAQLEAVMAAVPMPASIERHWHRSEPALQLVHAGIELRPRAFLGLRWILIWLGLLLALLLLLTRPSFFRGFLALVVLLFCWWGPRLWLRWRIEDRRRTLNHSLPDLMDRLRLGLEAGLGFELALRRTVRHHGGLLGEELNRMLLMLDRGHTKAEALDRLVERNPSPDLRAFAAAVKQAERLGSSLTKTLNVQGELLRARRRRRAQEASRRLPILIVFPLVFFFLPALLIVYLGPPLLHLFLGR